MTDSLYARARIALAVAGREAADLARGIVGDVSTPMRPGERIREARRVRLLSLSLVDRAVLAELSEGATWDDVADALGKEREEARRIYEPVWRDWMETGGTPDDFGDFGLGLSGDPDLKGTAEALDAWWNRHAEPWETSETRHPVAKALVDGEASPGDRQGI